MALDTSKIKLELGQVYDTADQGLSNNVQTVVYLPDDSPDLVACKDQYGFKKFHSREIIKRCIVLGMWKLRKDTDSERK